MKDEDTTDRNGIIMLERDNLSLLQGMQDMATQERTTQSVRKQVRRYRYSLLLTLGIVILAALVLSILNIFDIFQESWIIILVSVFSVLGLLITSLEWLVPIPSEKAGNEAGSPDTDKSAIATEIYNYAREERHLRSVSSSLVPGFQYNVPLTDPLDFFGRETELRKLLDRTRKGASTLIVGPRKIGKTWLLRYLQLVAPKELGSQYRMVYINAASPASQTIRGFTASILDELDDSTVANRSGLGLENLALAVRDLKKRENVTTVVCIDNFEAWSGKREFDAEFFSGLRGCTQDGLVLVIASRRLLDDVLGDTLGERSITSPFSNIFTRINLKPFTGLEAERFIHAKAQPARLTEEEEYYLLEYTRNKEGKWPPALLQLAGEMLVEDKLRSGKDENDAYHPDDPEYWHDFEKRLKEAYIA